MKTTVIYFFLLILPLSVMATDKNNPKNELKRLLENAAASFQKKEYSQAISFLQGALRSGANKGIIHFNIGNCYYSMGEIGKAQLSYQKVMRLAPQYLNAYLNYARISLKYDSPGEAIGALKKALRFHPRDETALILLGDSYQQSGSPGDAVFWYQKARDLYPASPHAYYSLVDSYLSVQDLKTAVSILEQGAPLIKDNGNLFHYLSTIYRKMNQTDKAITALEQGISMAKNKLPYLSSLAQLYIQINKPWLAINTLERAIALSPREVDRYAQLASLYNQNNYYIEAGRILLKGAGIQYRSMYPHLYNHAVTLYNRKRYRELVPFCRKVLQLNRNDREFDKLLKLALSKRDD